MKKLVNSKGYTLVEALVALGIFAVVGVVMVELILRTFQSSNKLQIISIIRQNGQNVLYSMEEAIRNSESVVCVGSLIPGTNNVLVVAEDDSYTRFIFKDGYVSRDTPSYPDDDNLQSLCDDVSVLNKQHILTDTDEKNGVNVTGGKFSIVQVNGSKGVVAVEFLMGPASKATSGFEFQVPPEKFQTTISLR